MISHELGHIANKDLGVFTWLQIAFGTWKRLMILLPLTWVIGVISSWEVVETEGGLGLILYAIMLFVITAVGTSMVFLVWLFSVRYFSFIVSVRESYADVRAYAWLNSLVALRKLVLSVERAKALRSHGRLAFMKLRFSHLPARERLQRLENPSWLIRPKVGYMLVLAMALLLLKHSLHSGTSLYPTLVLSMWLLLGVPFLYGLTRWSMGRALEIEEGIRYGPMARIVLAGTIFLLIPSIQVHALTDLPTRLIFWKEIGFHDVQIGSELDIFREKHDATLLLSPLVIVFFLYVSMKCCRCVGFHGKLSAGPFRTVVILSLVLGLALHAHLSIVDMGVGVEPVFNWLSEQVEDMGILAPLVGIVTMCMIMIAGSIGVIVLSRIKKARTEPT